MNDVKKPRFFRTTKLKECIIHRSIKRLVKLYVRKMTNEPKDSRADELNCSEMQKRILTEIINLIINVNEHCLKPKQ